MSEPSAPPVVEYRPVVGFPDYRVGNDGSVWSRKVRGSRFGRIGGWRKLKSAQTNPAGHQFVQLCRDQTCYPKLVHHLVLEAFVGPCPEDLEACHNDGNPRNNNVSNLRWDTHQSNMADKLIHGTHNKGSRHGHAKLTEESVRAIRAAYEQGAPQRSLAKQFDVSPATLCLIINRKTWCHI